MNILLAYLRGLDPRLFYALVAGATWLTLFAWRKISIASWDAVTRRNALLQQLPAMVLSGLISAAPAVGQPLAKAVVDIVMGVVLGAGGAALAHNALKAAPWVPYTGASPPKPPPPPEPTTTAPRSDTSARR